MKRFVVFITALFIFLVKSQGQIYMADSCRVAFFSAASIEDISAENTTPILVMSTTKGDIQISISNEGFIFKKKLMQEHFNEDYMESDKYPKTIFKGKVNEQVDYAKDGVSKVTVTGDMDMHGVKKTITIPGTITIKNGVIFLFAKFDARLADYNIKIPTMLGKNIAEEVAITLTATMKPSKAK
jgi:YceI-like domain